MEDLPFSPTILLICILLIVVEIISRKSDRFKVGRMGILGIFITLLPQAKGNITSISFIIGIAVSFIGIIIIILDKREVQKKG